jgi:hypothetical protein
MITKDFREETLNFPQGADPLPLSSSVASQEEII